MASEQIANWKTHRADAGDRYLLVYLGKNVPQLDHDPADFRRTLALRTGVDVTSLPRVNGATMLAEIAVLRSDSLMRLVGQYILSGRGGHGYEYELMNVIRTERAPAGAGLFAPLAQLGEWIKDQVGNVAARSARDGVLDDVAGVAPAVGGRVLDTAEDVARRAVPVEVWLALAALAGIALVSSLAPEPRR